MIYAPVNRVINSSSVDGQGNRTVFFFQGCNFNCGYCHNPETINMCEQCGLCIPSCPTASLKLTEGIVRYNRETCCDCDTCLRVCPHNSSPKITWMTPDEGAAILNENLPFIRGITVSGGECSLHRDFVIQLFQKAKTLGLNALMDSNGNYKFSEDPALLAICDGIMLDIKCFDAAAHLSLTGQPNDLVLQNLEFLASVGKLEEVRTVIVPDALPNEETVSSVCRCLSPYWAADIDIGYKLIRFRPFGVRDFYRVHTTPHDALMERLHEIVLRGGCKRVIVV
jgi:pyruvate formate lyase activating enzyme